MRLHVVAGAQYGSEAKGHITHRIVQQATREGLHTVNIRVAGPNAGHTVYDSEGQKFALRQVPVGAVEEGTILAIGPGSEIDLDVLRSEIDLLEESGHKISDRLFIDPQATIMVRSDADVEAGLLAIGTGGHVTLEHGEGADLHQSMGSTGKGIGAARAARILRVAETAGQYQGWDVGMPALVPTADLVGPDSMVVIEGTQGYGLGLHAGHYPQSTTSDCRGIDFCAMAGIMPWEAEQFNIWLVARTFPIRVAGNSGPLKDETTWEALGLPEERTTVTRKTRRVGGWDRDLVADAIAANGRSVVVLAITMLDQKFPEAAGVEAWWQLPQEAREWVLEVQKDLGVYVPVVTTGPTTAVLR